jgi:hypothetical protein
MRLELSVIVAETAKKPTTHALSFDFRTRGVCREDFVIAGPTALTLTLL